MRIGFDLLREIIVHAKTGTEPGDRLGCEQRRRGHRVKLSIDQDKGARRFVSLRLGDKFWKRKRHVVQLRPAGVEEEFSFNRGNQDDVGLDPPLQAFQSRKCRQAIPARAGERFLKGVVSRDDRRRADDLLIALLDQLYKNPRSDAQAWSFPRVEMSDREVALWQVGAVAGLPLLAVYLGLLTVMLRKMR